MVTPWSESAKFACLRLGPGPRAFARRPTTPRDPATRV